MAAKILEGITQAKKSGGASGSGGEKKKEKGDLRQTVDLLSRLVLTHESEISVLTAASSWAVLIKDATLKKELEDLRRTIGTKVTTRASMLVYPLSVLHRILYLYFVSLMLFKHRPPKQPLSHSRS